MIAEKAAWRWAHEFDLPFEKRVWAGMPMHLKQKGFSEWCANECRALENDPDNGCHVATQFIADGGQHSCFFVPWKVCAFHKSRKVSMPRRVFLRVWPNYK